MRKGREIYEEGDRVLVARGGDGGSPTNGFMPQLGEACTKLINPHIYKHHVKIIIKTISDVSLVGFPNAGKSTLLKAIARSRFKPRIAAYPFTTLSPLMGTLEYPDLRTISIVDLPGLIEMAHANRGLGHSFLRHVERTKILLIMIDVQGFQLDHKNPYRTPLETFLLLNKELELYDPLLVYKPAMVLINKMDTKNATAIYDRLVHDLQNIKDVLPTLPEEMRPKQLLQVQEIAGVSAKKNEKSVAYVKDRIRVLLDLYTDELCAENATDLATVDNSKDEKLFLNKLKEHNVKLV
ncbi:hypothetical protein HAZT_HAZT005883 [Hyalella azteca]|uniref:OBG-type G domain-containing protein n=1 Tax=Hyalella azteca TaxID=294128 RepID=A0A6A0HBE3_HYAAZ|nr:hypothetical protein HAZT_HAZT005883 [Hyalella azteca]